MTEATAEAEELTEQPSPPFTGPVDASGLRPVSLKPPLVQYVQELWGRRHFIVADARARAFQNTRGMLLGRVWLILSPFLNSMVYWFVFGMLLQISRGIPIFMGYLVVGYNFFEVVRSALGAGPQIISGSANLVKAYSFPRISVVFAWTLRAFLDFLPVLAATLIFVLVMPTIQVPPTIFWLLIPVSLLLGFTFVFGLAAISTALTTLAPDLKFVWPMATRVWFFTSGVFFGTARFENVPTVKALVEANPGYSFLEINRDLIVYGQMPPGELWLYFAAWAIVMAIVGFLFFWLIESKYGQKK